MFWKYGHPGGQKTSWTQFNPYLLTSYSLSIQSTCLVRPHFLGVSVNTTLFLKSHASPPY